MIISNNDASFGMYQERAPQLNDSHTSPQPVHAHENQGMAALALLENAVGGSATEIGPSSSGHIDINV